MQPRGCGADVLRITHSLRPCLPQGRWPACLLTWSLRLTPCDTRPSLAQGNAATGSDPTIGANPNGAFGIVDVSKSKSGSYKLKVRACVRA